MAYRSTSWSGFGASFRPTPMVKRLIVVTVGVSLLAWIVRPLMAWLGFLPVAFPRTPWTILTYMFVHGGFGHLFFNMLGLFFFGPPLEASWGEREFLKFYLVCGLGGALLSLLAPQVPIIGASAAVFGVMLAFAMNWPDAPIYVFGIFPVKAKWLIAVFAGVTLLSIASTTRDGIAHLAHLGGFVAAFLYLKLDLARRFRFDTLKRRTGRSRIRVVDSPARRTGFARRDGGAGGAGQEGALLDEVDRVLDKIGREGIASLSEAEKKLLDDVSRRYRTN
jgi:membrane associated rhomboid family serine protease